MKLGVRAVITMAPAQEGSKNTGTVAYVSLVVGRSVLRVMAGNKPREFLGQHAGIAAARSIINMIERSESIQVYTEEQRDAMAREPKQ